MLLFDLIRPAAGAVAGRLPSPPLDITYVDVCVPNLPEALSGFRLAHISDLHIGKPPWGPDHMDEVARSLAEEQPDLVLNTGDFLEGEPPFGLVREAVQPIVLPGEDRNFGMLGNHDYFLARPDVDKLIRVLRETGVQILENRAVCIRKNGEEISLAGLTLDAPGWDETVARLTELKGPKILLIHEPDRAERLPNGIADLILAGHTHGGQITVPGLETKIVRTFCGSKYVEGRYTVNGSPLYISRGLGCVGIPLRFRARPQLTFITLFR